jgi:hypothetical protein
LKEIILFNENFKTTMLMCKRIEIISMEENLLKGFKMYNIWFEFIIINEILVDL